MGRNSDLPYFAGAICTDGVAPHGLCEGCVETVRNATGIVPINPDEARECIASMVKANRLANAARHDCARCNEYHARSLGLEAERDALIAAGNELQKVADSAIPVIERLAAERDALRAEVEAFKARNIDMEIAQMELALHNARTENAQMRSEVETWKRQWEKTQALMGDDNARLRAEIERLGGKP